jgi:hypothetical protein
MKVTTCYGETARLIERRDNCALVSVNGNLEWFHASKLFINGKALA